MIRSNYFNDNEDLMLHFSELIPWQEIVDAREDGFHDAKRYKETGDEALSLAPGSLEEAVEFYRSLLESAGEIAGNEIAPSSLESDQTGLTFDGGRVGFPEGMKKGFDTLLEAGLIPYGISRANGGLGIPVTIQSLYMEILSRADASLAITVGCFNLGETIERYASKEIIQEYVPSMTEGSLCGAMALTEPDYGSDLQNIQTRAVKQEDGSYRITGNKRFITHAAGFDDKPCVILTLARTGESGSGARGLSFFLVHNRDVTIPKIEHKLGLRCSPTCDVLYEDSPALLIGEESQGLIRYAMGMMNGARLHIASQALGIATAAWMEAKQYASQRIQFGRPIGEIPAVRRMLERMETELAAMRALQLEASRSVDLYLWRWERLKESGEEERKIRKDPQVREFDKLASFLTPLSKYYLSEWSNRIAYDALQIFGGAGYTEEYDLSRLYRDARITSIYEGTSQMQIVAATGGIVGGMGPSGYLRHYLDERMEGRESSQQLLEIRTLFDSILESFQALPSAEERDSLALSLVESAAGMIASLLLERSLGALTGEAKEKRSLICRRYQTEALAVLRANAVRIGEGK